jgi:lipopolysaccharide export system permease protein
VKTLHLYVTRQVLASLLMTVMVFTFVLLLGNALKEILALIVGGQATLGMIAQAMILLVPFVLVFALPMGMLTATLLVFGRFSADQELTAARASGISLVALSTPVLLLGVATSLITGLINLQVAPRCRDAYRNLVYRVGIERATSLIAEDRFIDDFDGFVVYIGRKNGPVLENVLIYELTPDKQMKRRLQAERAEILSDTGKAEAILRLYKVHFYDFLTWQTGSAEEQDSFRMSYLPTRERKQEASLSNMTFVELWQKLGELERLGAIRTAVPAGGGDPAVLRDHQKRLRQAKADLTMPVRVQMHRQVAFSFACIGFTLVGIPLGIRAHRRETTAGFAMALVLVVLYYAFIILAQSLQDRPDLGPHLILWLPNFVFQVVGGVLLWRANRGF